MSKSPCSRWCDIQNGAKSDRKGLAPAIEPLLESLGVSRQPRELVAGQVGVERLGDCLVSTTAALSAGSRLPVPREGHRDAMWPVMKQAEFRHIVTTKPRSLGLPDDLIDWHANRELPRGGRSHFPPFQVRVRKHNVE